MSSFDHSYLCFIFGQESVIAVGRRVQSSTTFGKETVLLIYYSSAL